MSDLKDIQRECLKKALTLITTDENMSKIKRDAFLIVLARKHMDNCQAEGLSLDETFDAWNDLMTEIVTTDIIERRH